MDRVVWSSKRKLPPLGLAKWAHEVAVGNVCGNALEMECMRALGRKESLAAARVYVVEADSTSVLLHKTKY